MEELDPLLLLILGWLLGVLGGPLVEYLREKRTTRRLQRALLIELGELRYTMAQLCWSLRSRLGTIDRAFLDWFQAIHDSYDGVRTKPELWEKLKALPDSQLAAIVAAGARPSAALTLKQYPAPFLDNRLGDLELLPEPWQKALHQVQHHLSLLNQDVARLQRLVESARGEAFLDSAATASDLADGHQQLASRAQQIADAVSRVLGLQ